jgi:hypothetical protein
MEENINAPGLTGFVEKNHAIIKRMELISFVIFIVGFLLYELNVDDSNIILIVGILATAISLFLQGFKMIEFEDLESFNLLGSISFINFFYKLYFFSLSVSLMSLLGFVKEFKKSNTAAIVGGSTLIIILILTFLSKIQDKSKVYDLKFYARIFICLLFLTILAIEKGIIK